MAEKPPPQPLPPATPRLDKLQEGNRPPRDGR